MQTLTHSDAAKQGLTDSTLFSCITVVDTSHCIRHKITMQPMKQLPTTQTAMLISTA